MYSNQQQNRENSWAHFFFHDEASARRKFAHMLQYYDFARLSTSTPTRLLDRKVC